MQPSPIADTSRPLFPSLRFCIFLLRNRSPISRLESSAAEAVSRFFPFIACFSGLAGQAGPPWPTQPPPIGRCLTKFVVLHVSFGLETEPFDSIFSASVYLFWAQMPRRRSSMRRLRANFFGNLEQRSPPQQPIRV